MINFPITHRHSGKTLFTAEIDCDPAARRGQKLRLAVLCAIRNGHSLAYADLREADLRGTDLTGADLTEAEGYIIGPQRSDGYRFDLRFFDGVWRVGAGCRTYKNWTIDQYRAHTATYDNPSKTAETNDILDYLEARAARAGQEEKTK